MKQINLSLLLIIFFLISGCNNNNTTSDKNKQIVKNTITSSNKFDDSSLPKIKFDKETFDFGVIIQGEKVSHTFKYKNTGGTDLIIREVKATCGCTVAKFSKDPLAPGQEGTIEVVFNSEHRTGMQHKIIFIWSNTQPDRNNVSITAEVVVPK